MTTVISKTPVTFINVHKALLHVARIHPMLRATIETDGKPWFNFKNDTSVEVEELKTSDWESVCRQIQAESFSDMSKLWHGKVLAVAEDEQIDSNYPYHCKLILTMHHVIGDGLSMITIMKGIYDYIEADLSGTIIEDPVPLPVPPTAEQLMHIRYIPIYHSLVKLLGIVARLILKIKKKTNDTSPHTSFIKRIIQQEMTKPTFGRRGINTITSFFTQEQTALLIRACEHHKVSPMSTLMAGFFLTVADHLPVRDAKDIPYQFTFVVHNKINLKGRVASLGLGLINVWPNLQTRDTFWGTTIQCQRGVHKDLAKRQKDLVKLANKIPTFLPKSSAASGVMERLVNVNNYGKIGFTETNDPSIKIISITGSLDCGIMYPLHICLSCTEGKLHWWLNHRTDVVSEETANKMVKSINGMIMRNIQLPRCD